MYNLRQSVWSFHFKLTKFVAILFEVIKLISTNVCWVIQKICNRLNGFLQKVGDETGILALKLMLNTHLHTVERLFWLFTFIVSIYGAFFITDLQITRYMKSPTVISVDRNYRDWEGLMPAITLCYYDRVDTRASIYLLEKWNVSHNDEQHSYFMNFLYAVANASVSNYADIAKYAADERFSKLNLYEIAQATRKPFEQVISTFEGNFEISVRMDMTERGSCYTINSAISEIFGPRSTFQNINDLKYPLKCKFSKQKCYIKIDILESTGYVEVHSPYDISLADASVINLQKSSEIKAAYKVSETVASSNLRDLGVEQRNCVFNDEETSKPRFYSKNLCLATCHARQALEVCKCVPFFYTFVDGPACNPDGFKCLLEIHWPSWDPVRCKCPSTCTDTQYTLQTVKKSSWGVKGVDDATDSDALTSSFRCELIPPKVRLRRDVVFSFEDLLVSFGGTLGLFLGLSIFSLISVAYCLTESFLNDISILIYLTFKYCRHINWKRLKLNRELILVKDARKKCADEVLSKIVRNR